ncbi:MAG: lipoyl synthase [Oscillospiraceae bacterium]|nr:lipoyl synthase [Oscillospiraceae bacterium]
MLKKPDWLRIPHKHSPNQAAVEALLESLQLNTVCQEANCPNYAECFSQKTATIMILGANCTRDCRFCNVRHAEPTPVDPEEPMRVAEAVKALGLRYVVITSVTRDDLPDGGTMQFAQVIQAIRNTTPGTAIEVLIPDFMGNPSALAQVIAAAPNVISHNMETVAALYPQIRPGADYVRSLTILHQIKTQNPAVRSKSGIMLGFGETEEQVLQLFDDLLEVGCEFLTIGQYLAPSKAHYPVQSYVTPAQFEAYGAAARAKGFAFVASAPLVRSSYHAGEALGL